MAREGNIKNPAGLIGATFCQERHYKEFKQFLKQVEKELREEFPNHKDISLEPREIRFFEIHMPLDTRYDSFVKKLKRVTRPGFQKKITRHLPKKIINFFLPQKYKLIKNKNMKKEIPSGKILGLGNMFMPLFAEEKKGKNRLAIEKINSKKARRFEYD